MSGPLTAGEEMWRFDRRFEFCEWGVTALTAEVVGRGTRDQGPGTSDPGDLGTRYVGTRDVGTRVLGTSDAGTMVLGT